MALKNVYQNEDVKKNEKYIDQISSRLFSPKGSIVLPLEIRNASLALRIPSLFEVMSSRGTSSMLPMEWAGRVNGSWLIVRLEKGSKWKE